MSKKYPEYTHQQSEEWGNLFETQENDSFYFSIFDKLYYKGYCIFSKSESIYKEISETLDKFVPSVPYEIKDIDRLSVEIDIKC
jgi:hypothetical protein